MSPFNMLKFISLINMDCFKKFISDEQVYINIYFKCFGNPSANISCALVYLVDEGMAFKPFRAKFL